MGAGKDKVARGHKIKYCALTQLPVFCPLLTVVVQLQVRVFIKNKDGQICRMDILTVGPGSCFSRQVLDSVAFS